VTSAQRGGHGKCAACALPDQRALNEQLVAGASLRALAKRYGISRPALTHHKRAHVSPALVAVKEQRLARGARTIVDRLERLLLRTEAILDAAYAARNGKLALVAIRELRSTLELVARLTGELDQRPAVTVNLQTSPEWARVRAVVMEFVPPERRAEMARRLQLLGKAGGDDVN
jgi:hypothetical protein